MVSKVIVFKNAGYWAGFTLQTRYLVRKFIFVILSTCHAHQGVHYVFLVNVIATVRDLYTTF